jgi:hypothetical protein
MKPTSVTKYHECLDQNDRDICEVLYREINSGLPESKNKIWHGHPVWFLNDNPIVGYAKLKSSVQLLFWSGQSFDEPTLKAEGTFKAAQSRYTSVNQINIVDLRRWIKKSKTIQWDYKNIVRRRGVLEKIS